MKLYHFSIIFALFFFVVIIVSEMRISEQDYIASEGESLEHVFDDAVDAATNAMSRNIADLSESARNEAVEAFLKALYVGFGVLDEPKARKELAHFVPIIAVTVEDGLYIWYNEQYTDAEGYRSVTGVWSEKIPYCFDDGFFIYGFSTGTKAVVYDRNCYLEAEPDYYAVDVEHITDFFLFDELIHAIPESEWGNCLLTNKERYVSTRAAVVAETIEKSLNYYCNTRNMLGQAMGETYRFHIPEMDGGLYLRAASQPSFLAFFQGYPIAGTASTYDRYAVSNAQIRAREIYAIDNESLYHREGCSHAGEIVSNAYTKEECASQGAFACPYCFPNTGAKKRW